MLSLERRYLDEIVAHARDELPNEACGIVVGKDGVPVKLFRGLNTEASPYRYYLDKGQLFQIQRECWANGWDFLAIYHSHTKSKAYPSATDVKLAFWPEAYYVLVSLQDTDRPVVRAFRILDGAVSEEELRTL